MMAVAFGPTSCSSGLVPKSKLLHSPEAQSGLVPRHSLHRGKNIALRAEKPLAPPDLPEEDLRTSNVGMGKVEICFLAKRCFCL